MCTRIIAHLDIDSFFVQAELLERKHLQGKAVAVFQHSDIISVSYEARQAGVKKHDIPEDVAERFPDVYLISVPTEKGTSKVSYAKYMELSSRIFDIVSHHVTGDIEKGSIDEVYFDMTDQISEPTYSLSQSGNDNSNYNIWSISKGQPAALSRTEENLLIAANICHNIRMDIIEKTGIHCSIGVGNSKLIAKITSSIYKPDQLTVILPRSISAFLNTVPLTRLGRYWTKLPVNLQSFLSENAQFIGQCIYLEPQIKQLFESSQESFPNEQIEELMRLCAGQDDSRVKSSGAPKSLSVSMTLTPIYNSKLAAIRKIIEYLVADLQTRLQSDSKKFVRKPLSVLLRLRLVDQKEMKAPATVNMAPYLLLSVEKKEKSITSLNNQHLLVDKLLEQLQAIVKDYPQGRLRWVGLFCSKFQRIDVVDISQFFSTSPSKINQNNRVSENALHHSVEKTNSSYPLVRNNFKKTSPQKTITKPAKPTSTRTQKTLSSFFK